jgi:hypothetical protein
LVPTALTAVGTEVADMTAPVGISEVVPMTGHRISCHEGEALTIADAGFVRGEVAECRM